MLAGRATLIETPVAIKLFGWATLLLASWPAAVPGHDELFSHRPRTRPAPYLTRRERSVVILEVALSLAYWGVAWLR